MGFGSSTTDNENSKNWVKLSVFIAPSRNNGLFEFYFSHTQNMYV